MAVKPVLTPVGRLPPPDLLNTKKANSVDFSHYMGDADAPSAIQKPEDELSAYLKKSPAERMRDAILKQLGLTQDELNAMPPEQRKGVEAQITDLMKQALEKSTQKTGNNIDTSA
jgi:TPP-dependent pyruvate/acetoin dehydrogenase alpha subunit